MNFEEEIEEYDKLFKHLNLRKEEQQQVLEFFYIIGTMIYTQKID